MIYKTAIQTTLYDLNRLFVKEKKASKQVFYSKLALMELCGWIEITMDNIVNCTLKKHLSNLEHIKSVQKAIRYNSNFNYESNFKPLLTHVIGLKGVELVEKKLTQQKFVTMKAALDYLKTPRNSAAHTFIKGMTQTIDAPSVIIAKFLILLEGFKDFVTAMKQLKFL
ncbi:hypothetical protein [Pantoea dispersa]|uniref:hypothetical protein n=1 Tax=Pantoea dispersa TaxID=59814 RepID=UPI001CA6729F|nr:hypothetical protein [Pantoea dispersa]QZY95988.1 hypothetical protein K7X52_05990 [Pantoea dispersa]